MINGKVTSEREAVIRLDIAGPNGQWRAIETIVDTGFNGFLTLPDRLVENLALSIVGNRRAALGDGSDVVLDIYLAMVLWHEQEREVLALKTAGAPLVGMSLLQGSRLTLDVIADGDVIIDEFS